MSIATELWRNLTGGKMTVAQAWSSAESKIEADVGHVVAHGGAIAQMAAQDLGPVIKQGLSDAIAMADTAIVTFLGPATDTVATAFQTAANGYLGPVVGAELSSAARDGLYKIRDGMIAEINAQALAMEATLTVPKPASVAVPLASAVLAQAAAAQGTQAVASSNG